mgnify:CR=1 FL=1
MIEINVKSEKAKYQAEYDAYIRQLQELEVQRAQLVQAIQERRGILIFLESLNTHREKVGDIR